jgi:hypothetical protein
MQRDAQHHQADAGRILECGDLAQHDRADDGGEHRQQRQHQGERGARQPGHGQLVAHVGNDRGAYAHPGPGQQQDRAPERGQRAAESPRRGRHRGDGHGCPQLVDAGEPLAAGVGYPVAQDDVGHEQAAVGEGKGEAERVAVQPDRGDDDHSRRGEGQRPGVAPGPRPGRGQDHGPEKLDRAHRRQREPRHRQVERRVHHGQHHAQGQQRPAARRTQRPDLPDQPSRPPPGREHHRRAGDPQPRHPEHAHPRKQQHRQRRPQVMEGRADQEERLRRNPPPRRPPPPRPRERTGAG